MYPDIGYAHLSARSTGKKSKHADQKEKNLYYVCSKHNVKLRITTGTLFEGTKIGTHQILQIFWCCLNKLSYTQARMQLKDEGMKLHLFIFLHLLYPLFIIYISSTITYLHTYILTLIIILLNIM